MYEIIFWKKKTLSVQIKTHSSRETIFLPFKLMGICSQDENFHQENMLLPDLMGCLCLLALTSATC